MDFDQISLITNEIHLIRYSKLYGIMRPQSYSYLESQELTSLFCAFAYLINIILCHPTMHTWEIGIFQVFEFKMEILKNLYNVGTLPIVVGII